MESLTQIQETKIFVDAVPLSRDAEERLWKKFRLEWNYNSNHIEGNTLTYDQTELFLLFDETTGDHLWREYQEMKAHDTAIKMVVELANDIERPLTEAVIKKLNEIILVESFWKEAITADGQKAQRQILIGDYKKFPNSVRLSNGELFNYASPQEIPALMGDLMNWYNENLIAKTDAIEIAALFHYKFVRIHPFDDGNGRIARLIMNYILMRNGYPPVIIKSSEKNKYLFALHRADVGDERSFIDYVASQLSWSLNLKIKAANGEDLEEEEDLDKEIELLVRDKISDNVQLKKSRQILQQIYNESLKNLLEEINIALKKFDKLFVEEDHSVNVEPSINTVPPKVLARSISYIENQIFFDFSHPEKYGYVGNMGYTNGRPNSAVVYPDITKVKLYFYWKGYKNVGTDAFNIHSDIEIYFDDYKYLLLLNGSNNVVLQKLYSQILTKEEATRVTRKMANEVLNRIHQNLDRIKKKS